jgi:hypothetical protein
MIFDFRQEKGGEFATNCFYNAEKLCGYLCPWRGLFYGAATG